MNAQLSILKGMEAAKRHGYVFVVPPLVQWCATSPAALLACRVARARWNTEHVVTRRHCWDVELPGL